MLVIHTIHWSVSSKTFLTDLAQFQCSFWYFNLNTLLVSQTHFSPSSLTKISSWFWLNLLLENYNLSMTLPWATVSHLCPLLPSLINIRLLSSASLLLQANALFIHSCQGTLSISLIYSRYHSQLSVNIFICFYVFVFWSPTPIFYPMPKWHFSFFP